MQTLRLYYVYNSLNGILEHIANPGKIEGQAKPNDALFTAMINATNTP